MSVRALPDKILRLKNIGKSFTDRDSTQDVLQDINLTVHPEEFVSIVGVQGCGKSSLLRLLAGLDTHFSGELLFGGKAISGPELKRGIVFQDCRLLPWLTVFDNVAIALANVNVPAAQKQQRVQKYIDLLGLNELAQLRPRALSDGQACRVAIARALVGNPDLLVLDEPFKTLDAITRIHLQGLLHEVWRREKMIIILVTHDVDEAVFLADRIVVMEPNPGRIKRILVGPEQYPRDRTSVAFNAVKRLVLAQIEGDSANNQAPAYVDFNRLAEVRMSW